MLVAAMLICLLGCGASVWFARASRIAPLVLPGATDVVVTNRDFTGVSIAYQAAGHPWEWRGTISRLLLSDGWRSRDYLFGGSSSFVVTWYTRSIVLGPLTIVDNAVVGGDPTDPHTVRIEASLELHLFR
jgi:hypothetical protein